MILGTHNVTQAVPVVVGTPVVAGSGVESMPIPYPITIKARPGVGGTLLVEYRVDPTDDFTAWPSGTVAAATVMKLNGPVEALRFTAEVADGSVRLAQ